MWAPRFIEKVRDGTSVGPKAIRDWIRAFTDGEVTDAQMAAWAMAVVFRGLAPEETLALTLAMRDSGKSFSWEGGWTADKHSTGGVGDKVSLALAPWAAACGVRVPMISGRGLGHTGGTLDKLDAIPGFSSRMDARRFEAIVHAHGLVLAGQSAEVAPADRKLYALRDVTGTVESIPLITASILSKKLAEGLDALVLDVKVGAGAFMKTMADARALGESLRSVAGRLGCETQVFYSSMDGPLGRSVGNANELDEALALLKGEASRSDFETLTRRLTLAMLPPETSVDVDEVLHSGAAFERLCRCVVAQGGQLDRLERPRWREGLPERLLRAPASGFFAGCDGHEVGLAAMQLGAGRRRPEDVIDGLAGIDFEVSPGEEVSAGEVWARLFGRDETRFDAAEARLRAAARWSEAPVEAVPVILEAP
ncbi:MAG: thymidine phosphorylase [Myxococcota bacterium]